MGFRYRRRIKLGPVTLHFSERGFTSYSVKLGPWTWNPTRRRISTDLPGGISHTRKYGGTEK